MTEHISSFFHSGLLSNNTNKSSMTIHQQDWWQPEVNKEILWHFLSLSLRHTTDVWWNITTTFTAVSAPSSPFENQVFLLHSLIHSEL